MIQTTNEVRIVPMYKDIAEVRVPVAGEYIGIGRVGNDRGGWYWQHRDGERSSAVASDRAEAAIALVHYHTAFKPPLVRARARFAG